MFRSPAVCQRMVIQNAFVSGGIFATTPLANLLNIKYIENKDLPTLEDVKYNAERENLGDIHDYSDVAEMFNTRTLLCPRISIKAWLNMELNSDQTKVRGTYLKNVSQTHKDCGIDFYNDLDLSTYYVEMSIGLSRPYQTYEPSSSLSVSLFISLHHKNGQLTSFDEVKYCFTMAGIPSSSHEFCVTGLRNMTVDLHDTADMKLKGIHNKLEFVLYFHNALYSFYEALFIILNPLNHRKPTTELSKDLIRNRQIF